MQGTFRDSENKTARNFSNDINKKFGINKHKEKSFQKNLLTSVSQLKSNINKKNLLRKNEDENFQKNKTFSITATTAINNQKKYF